MDIYTRPINLLVRGGNQYYSTLLGSILSILTFLALISYTGYQLQLMSGNEDYFSKLEVYEDEYSSNEPFYSQEIGFHIAAAISDYSNTKEIIEDPTYGEVVFMRKNWDT